MVYRYLEGIVIADAAFEVEADNLKELFEQAARATFEVMVELDDVKPVAEKEVVLENDSVRMLLHQWLSELIYLKDIDEALYSEFDVTVEKSNGNFILKARIKGEKIDMKKHRLGSDVKGVTFYMFSVENKDNRWKARVVLDL